VSAIEGMAGIGKTQLAVRAAHQLVRAGRYAEIQLSADLHGFDADQPPTDPAVQLSALSIHALVLMFKPNPMGEIVARRLRLDFAPDQIVEHVTGFALAGLRPYRSRPV